MKDKKFDKLIKKSLSVDLIRFAIRQELRAFLKEFQGQAGIAGVVAEQAGTEKNKTYFQGQETAYKDMARSIARRMEELK